LHVQSREDLTADYHDFAVAVQGLGFLESGITDPLNHFSNTLLEFSALSRHLVRLPRHTRASRHSLTVGRTDADDDRPFLASPPLSLIVLTREPGRPEIAGPEATRL
jgi:hypothetical protein